MLPLRVALVTFPFTSGINCMGFILAFMFLTEATQYFVHGGLQQIKGSLANPLSKINVTTSYENEAGLH